MKKYSFEIDNKITNNKILNSWLFNEDCMLSLSQRDDRLIFKIKELFFSSLTILIINTDKNVYVIFKRNNSCVLLIRGQMRERIKGIYINNNYLFNDNYLKLKFHVTKKLFDYDDLTISQISVNGYGFFKRINSKIPFSNENSLLITRCYDWNKK